MELPFRDQVWLSLIDKGGLAVVTVLFGTFGARALERYKARQTLHGVIATERLKRIADIHAKVLRLDAEASEMRSRLDSAFTIPIVMNGAKEDPSDTWKRLAERASKDIDRMEDAAAELRRGAIDESFWLGKGRTKRLVDQIDLLFTKISLLNLPPVDSGLPSGDTWQKFLRKLPSTIQLHWLARSLRRAQQARVNTGSIDDVIDSITK